MAGEYPTFFSLPTSATVQRSSWDSTIQRLGLGDNSANIVVIVVENRFSPRFKPSLPPFAPFPRRRELCAS